MAKATDKATVLTTLRIGQVEVPVAVFSATVDKPAKLAEFDTGGPNGGKLVARAVAKAVPVAEVPTDQPTQDVIDPFADDGPNLVPASFDDPKIPMEFGVSQEPPPAPPLEVAGEYGRELVEEGSDVVVRPQDVRRGVRLEDGRFIDCTMQLAEIDERTKLDAMTVVGFVDVTQIPRAWAKGAKYIGANSEAAPYALRLIFEGLRATRRGAVVKLTKRSRQTLGVIVAVHKVLMLFELVWREDFRDPPARARVIQQAAVNGQHVKQFVQLIEEMRIPVGDLELLRDDALGLREELKQRALAGEVADVVDAGVVEPADEIVEQLAASLAAVGS